MVLVAARCGQVGSTAWHATARSAKWRALRSRRQVALGSTTERAAFWRQPAPASVGASTRSIRPPTCARRAGSRRCWTSFKPTGFDTHCPCTALYPLVCFVVLVAVIFIHGLARERESDSAPPPAPPPHQVPPPDTPGRAPHPPLYVWGDNTNGELSIGGKTVNTLLLPEHTHTHTHTHIHTHARTHPW